MENQGKHVSEIESLRRTSRDLVAMSTLTAVWGDLGVDGIVNSLSGVLLSMLDLDLAYVRLTGGGGTAIDGMELIHSKPQDAAARLLPAARAALDGLPVPSAAQEPAAIAHPDGGCPLRASVVRLGVEGGIGALVVGSRRPDFPSEHERLLLGVAANQAAVFLQRRLAEQALARSELRFLDLADAAPAMLWVTEPDGFCSFLSHGWYAFTGQSKRDGLGFGWMEAIHPDDRPEARRAFLAANEQQKEFSLEHRLLHVDGSYRWVIDAGRPRLSVAGDFLGFVGNVLDITDRRQTEEALRETQRTLSAVFEALPVGVAVMDQQGKFVLSNQEMHQYMPTRVLPSLDEARHARWRAFHADGSLYARQDFPGARAMRGERVVPGIEALYTNDNGAELWTQVAAVPLMGSDGLPKGQVAVVTNIDAFKRTEAALRQSEASQRALFDEVTKSHKNLSEFLAVLAHELRNPLAPIVTGLEVMRMRFDSAETISSVRGIIERQVKQLSHLIDDLLDIARVTNGKVDIRKESVDLKAIVSNAVETSMPLIDKGRHAFSLQLDAAALPVNADPARIAQVIGNLLTNAAKYTPPGGSIALSALRDGGEAVISVVDSGVGIPGESLEAVFDMFSQVGRNMKHAQGGLGIGLSLVRQLVSLHDGSVAAMSEGAGKGSTFVVRLPLDLAGAAAGAGRPASDAIAGPGKTLRILVADDNIDAATTLAALLEMVGHELRVAHDGQGALRIAGQFQPDVVFLDIGMPDMTGYDVARQLRTMAGLERCAIAAVSGWGAKEDLVRSKEAGFDMHFTKPVAPARVSDFLDSLR
jgi:PAS domain S-box-containing protein